jgi:RNA polymerase sigma-70 factor (ECF subfamily)
MLTFLCAVARNHIMHHFRRSVRNVERTPDGIDVEMIEAEAAFGDPLKDLLDDELAKEIDRAIAGLPVLLREAIVLREFQELSYEEMASVTDVSVNVIKVRLHRARRTLAKVLAPYTNQDGGSCNEVC